MPRIFLYEGTPVAVLEVLPQSPFGTREETETFLREQIGPEDAFGHWSSFVVEISDDELAALRANDNPLATALLSALLKTDDPKPVDETQPGWDKYPT